MIYEMWMAVHVCVYIIIYIREKNRLCELSICNIKNKCAIYTANNQVHEGACSHFLRQTRRHGHHRVDRRRNNRAVSNKSNQRRHIERWSVS